jgi:hypothetical protein
MSGDAEVSVPAGLMADPGRARVLLALVDGRALPASRLAAEAGVEALVRISPATPVRSLKAGSKANALRRSRLCYDHLAGRLGVEVMGALIAQGALAGGLGAALATRLFELGWLRRKPQHRAVALTDAGHTGLRAALGLELEQAA